MKHLLVIVGVISAFHAYSFQMVQQEMAPEKEPSSELNASTPPFQAGEKLTYVLHYGIFNAGMAELIVSETDKTILSENKTLHVVGKGWTTGAVDVFFKVRDQYESYFDQKTLEPLLFIRRIDEGGFKLSQDYTFNPDSNKVTTQDNKEYRVPENIQDMVSAFYYARSLNFDTAQIGSIYTIPAFVDDEIFYMKLKLVGRETVSLRKGKYRCLKFNPLVQEGRIFKEEEDLVVWVTDDANKIPVLAQSKILVGSIKMELKGYEGLAHELAVVKD